MTLPLTDSGLIGTAMAASAIAVLALTSPARAPDTAPAAVSETAIATGDVVTDDLAPAVVSVAPDAGAEEPVTVDAEFGAQVRAYLMENPEVIFEAVAAFERRTAMSQADMDSDLVMVNASALFESPHDWVGGNLEGDITLVEFVDYRCGFCRRAHDEIEALLEQDQGIRFIVKEFPILGPDSEASSRFAIAVLQLAGPEAYKAAHDALITLQGPPDDFALEAISDEIGIDFAAVEAHMDSDEVSTVIEENRLLAQRLRISGTPTFVMETEMLRGYVPVDTLLELADALRG